MGGVELELACSVARVFASEDQHDNDRLVEVLLQSVTLKDPRAALQQVRIPAPGEVVYIVVHDSTAGKQAQRVEAGDLPVSGDVIRATVRDAGRGVWAARGTDWFETLKRAVPAPSTAKENSSDETVDFRGMTCKPKLVQGKLGLEVANVAPNTPAREAGFQNGDILLEIDGQTIRSTAEAAQIANGVKSLELTVIDVNTGRPAKVALGPMKGGLPSSKNRSTDASIDPVRLIAELLGVSVEETQSGLQGAVKVATVDREKPGGQAGLEPGDQIVGVNQTPVETVDQFARALAESGGRATLLVRDVRSGKTVAVPIGAAMGGRDSSPTKWDSAAAGTVDRLGMSTKIAFYDDEAAVRVVSVQPGGPASRAGIEPGWIITQAGEKQVMHPDDLNEAERNAQGRLTLRVVDPANNRPMTIDVAY